MLRLIEKSTEPAVSLDEMKQHLKRQDVSDDDEYIQACIDAATDWAEEFTGRSLVDSTYDYFLDAFPSSGQLFLPRGKLLEVIGVFGRDTSEAEFSGFSVSYSDDAPSIYLPASGSWPSVDSAPNAVRIRFRAGFMDTTGSPMADGEIPSAIKAAIKIYAATIYGQREVDNPAALSVRVPFGAESLLRIYRVDTSIA